MTVSDTVLGEALERAAEIDALPFYDDFGSDSFNYDNYRTAVVRVALGLCVIQMGKCVTHGVEESLTHFLETRPPEDNGHDPVTGFAYND